ncbi:acyltransferase family protein [Rhizosaccharibacter radicis]|uniref:Acyltransferase n=1 Tax=Rhizosaccharibacter radicis TaxID=2782605 RepID=A0ABT1VYL6_9PROT|nr:acyltransferase [Acetobacteraceae bacterium KSS12]
MSIGRRNGRIDLIRGISIALVLLHHFNIAYRLPASPLGTLFGPELVRAVCRNGNYGVTMFFTVSGFLITGNALRRWGELDRVRPLPFYGLRVARILPCLLLLLVPVTLLGLAGVPMFANRAEAGPPVSFLRANLAALSFTMNLLMQRAGWFSYCLCVLWSLSVEEVFYVCFPLICAGLRRPRRIVAVWIACILLGPTWRFFHQSDEAGFLYATPACLDGIAIGCLAALAATRSGVMQWLRSPTGRAAQAATVLLMAAFYLWRSIGVTNVPGVTLMALGTAMLMLGTPPDGGARGRAGAPMRWLGRHSYELYLFHLVALAFMRMVLPPAMLAPALKLPWLATFLLVSILLADAVARFWAEPWNRGIRRWLSIRSDRTASPVGAA